MSFKGTTSLLTFIFPVLIVTSGCAHKSTFKVEPDQHRDDVFQYCGGQEWGYVSKLSSQENSPSLGVYLENQILKDEDVIVFNFAIHSKKDLDIVFEDRNFEIKKNGTSIYNEPSNFWIVRGEKQIDQRYSGNLYTYKPVTGSSNQWRVRKKKYNGFFGMMALEDPVIVTIQKYPNEETKGNKVHVPFDTVNFDEIYVLDKIVIPLKEKRSTSGQYIVNTPAFIANGVKVPRSEFIFNFDREQLVERMKNTYRCASLEEIFRSNTNKDSWIWWMYPKVQ